MNNKGQVMGEGAMLFWRFFLLAGLVLFVALTVGAAFSSKQDIRNIESSVLYGKIAECIGKDGVVKSDFSIQGCFREDAEIYANVNITSFDMKLSKSSHSGNPAISVFCETGGQKFLYCANQTSYVLIEDNGKLERGIMTVTIGMEKYGANIQI